MLSLTVMGHATVFASRQECPNFKEKAHLNIGIHHLHPLLLMSATSNVPCNIVSSMCERERELPHIQPERLI